jgi:hypothetical protein
VPHSSRGLFLREAGAKAKPKRLNIALTLLFVLVFTFQTVIEDASK